MKTIAIFLIFIIALSVGLIVMIEVFGTANTLESPADTETNENFYTRGNYTLSQTPTQVTNVQAINNSWLNFDGTNDVLNIIPAEVYLNDSQDNFQISGWFLTNQNNSVRGIIGNSQSNNGVYVGLSSTGNLSFNIGRGEDVTVLTYPARIQNNQWYFFAALMNDSTATLYFNNESVSLVYGNVMSSAVNLQIGNTGQTSETWNGSLDEMRLSYMSPSEFTPTYIQELYRSGRVYNSSLTFPVEDDAVFWMSFDENQGTVTNSHVRQS